MSKAKISHGDCLDVLQKMQPASVDLVFGSPPYERARSYGIDFDLKGEAWVGWALPRYLACLRVCKGLVAWVVAGQTQDFRWSGTPALLMAELIRNNVVLRNPPVALYRRVGIPGSGGPDWLRSDYEWIICATNGGKLSWSDNTAMGHPPRWAPGGEMSHRLRDGERRNKWGATPTSSEGLRRRGKDEQGRGKQKDRPNFDVKKFPAIKRDPSRVRADGETEVQAYNPPVKANPGNVISGKVGGGLMGSRLAHENEAPFPEWLAEFFIRSFCKPGGTVLDPYSGSGTTASVAVSLGREAIAIDIRESQCDLTRRRLAGAQLELAGAAED